MPNTKRTFRRGFLPRRTFKTTRLIKVDFANISIYFFIFPRFFISRWLSATTTVLLPLVNRSFRLGVLLPAESLAALKHTSEHSQVYATLSFIHIRCCSRTWSGLKRPWIDVSFLAFSWWTLPLSWLTPCTKLGLVGIVAPEVVPSLTKHGPVRGCRGHAVYSHLLAYYF